MSKKSKKVLAIYWKVRYNWESSASRVLRPLQIVMKARKFEVALEKVTANILRRFS